MPTIPIGMLISIEIVLEGEGDISTITIEMGIPIEMVEMPKAQHLYGDGGNWTDLLISPIPIEMVVFTHIYG